MKRIISFVLSLLFGVLIGGFGILFMDFDKCDFIFNRYFFIFCLIIAIYFQVIIHEAGHLLFGLFTGYKFVSFRIFNITFAKIGNKLHVKRYKLAGTLGQCLMSPPEKKPDGYYPFYLYEMGGSFLNLIAAVFLLVLYRTIPYISFISCLFYSMFLAGLFIGISNAVPMKTTLLQNDGSNVVNLLKSPLSRLSFYNQLKVNALQQNHTRLKDMSDELFYLPSNEEMHNPSVAVMGVFYSSRLFDKGNFEEDYSLLKHLLTTENGIAGIHRALLTCDLISLVVLLKKDDDIALLLTKNQKSFMKAMKLNPSVLRCEYSIAIQENDLEKANRIKEMFEQMAKTYPYESEIIAEREFMENIKDA